MIIQAFVEVQWHFHEYNLPCADFSPSDSSQWEKMLVLVRLGQIRLGSVFFSYGELSHGELSYGKKS